MIRSISETEVVQEIVSYAGTQMEITLSSKNVIPVFYSILKATAKFLSECQAFQNKAALTIKKQDGEFIVAIILTKEIDDEGKTSFAISFELNEETFKAGEDEYDVVAEAFQTDFRKFVNTFTATALGLRFISSDMVYSFIWAAFDLMLKNLRDRTEEELSSEEEGYTLVVDDIIRLTAVLENGERKITIEPETGLKTFVKNDGVDQA